MRTQFIFLPLSLALAVCSSAFGTVTGLNNAPLGSRSNDDVQYALWDGFSVAAGTLSGGATLDAGLTQSVLAAPPYGPSTGDGGSTDLFYTSSQASSWTLTADATIEITTAVLQIKLSSPANPALSASTFFTPLFNGVAATPVLVASGIPNGSNNFSVVQWTWQNLDIAAGEAFTISFSSPAGQYHVAVDAVSLDVSSVPEPSTWALLGFGAIGVYFFSRRSSVRS